MRPLPLRLHSVLFPALVAAGCHNGSDVACTAVAEPAVIVELTDVGTGDPITGASVTLSEGAYSETMIEGLPGAYVGGLERPGTYQVDVSATGYVMQQVAGITAAALPCGPETQTVQIMLQPVTAAVLVIESESGAVILGRGLIMPAGDSGRAR